MRKMKRGSAILLALFTTVFLLGVAITVWTMTFIGMTILKGFLLTSIVLGFFVTLIDAWKWSNDKGQGIDYNEKDHYGPLNFLYKKYGEDVKPIKLGRWIWGAIILFLLFYVAQLIGVSAKQGVFVYNNSTILHKQFDKKTFEKKGFYEKMWKAYSEKSKIAFLNQEGLTKIVQIAMTNRKAGENAMWTWTQENQPMPYDEFSKFYADLSDFIASQREGYFKLETECQELANKNNILLDTFPNNILNKFLGCKKIEFEYGFTSDSTEKIFKSKKENI